MALLGIPLLGVALRAVALLGIPRFGVTLAGVALVGVALVRVTLAGVALVWVALGRVGVPLRLVAAVAVGLLLVVGLLVSIALLVGVRLVLVPRLGVAAVGVLGGFGVLAGLGVSPLVGILLLPLRGVLAAVGTGRAAVTLVGVILLGVVLRRLGRLGPRAGGQRQRARGQRPGTLGTLRRRGEDHRAGRVLGPDRAEVAGHRAGELGLAAVAAGRRRQPGVGRRPGKLAGVAAESARVVRLRPALQGVDQPRQLLHRQPARAGAGASLPDAEDRDSGIGVPAQPHTAGAAAHVEETLAEPGQRSCVRR